jgi:hypothetical protein
MNFIFQIDIDIARAITAFTLHIYDKETCTELAALQPVFDFAAQIRQYPSVHHSMWQTLDKSYHSIYALHIHDQSTYVELRHRFMHDFKP